MTVQVTPGIAPASPEPSRTLLAPRLYRDGLVGIPHQIQQIATRRILGPSGHKLGNPALAEVMEVLVLIAASVFETQITGRVVIDARAQSEVGRRLLEVMRDEVMQRWKQHGIVETQLPILLLAMERVRHALARGEAGSFAAHLGGSEGLKLLVQVAHDMRSPLASILCLAETLQHGESGAVNDVQRQQLGLICTAALGLSSVGSDIIDLERGELLLEPKPVPFSVTSVVESVRDIVRPMAEVKQLAIRTEPPSFDQRMGHPVALRRVLLNLTTNALKFTEQGFITIGTRETKPGSLEFAVSDSGRGIDPAVIPTLFDPVRNAPRADGELSSDRVFSSTGLGLTICRKLAEAMGSQLQVETQLGVGTRFFFELQLPQCLSRQSAGHDVADGQPDERRKSGDRRGRRAS